MKKALLAVLSVVGMFTASAVACSVGRANPSSEPMSSETIRSYPTWTPTPSEKTAITTNTPNVTATATAFRKQLDFIKKERFVDEKIKEWKNRYDAKVSPIYLIEEDNYSIFHGSHVIAMGNVDDSFRWIDITTGEHVGTLLVVKVDGPPDVEGYLNSGFLNAVIQPIDRYVASWSEDTIFFVSEVFSF